MSCRHILVMGVAGSGKSTIARALAERLGFEMIEGDDLHPPANVEKMRAGIPLTDDDRRPWLEKLALLLADRHDRGEATVLACSALKRSYRDILRSAIQPDEPFVVELDADPVTIRERMAARSGHFMPTSLLESQLATLEPLQADERGVIVESGRPPAEVVAAAAAALREADDPIDARYPPAGRGTDFRPRA
ncbi:MAG TPA: gluconokinase [Candidatus Limnocylindrales bacterium]|nr:gluconokinase [Candidatus Limnocylindrales bacterium]